MYKALVESYIKSMSFDTLKNYVYKNYKNVSDEEIEIIYKYIKNRWKEIYDEDKEVLNELKNELSGPTYNEVIKLLNTAYKFKNK